MISKIKSNENIEKLVNRETITYIIFGVLTTVVDMGVFSICIHLGMREVPSNNIAWVFSVLFAYITNKLIVFLSDDTSIKTILREFIMFVGARLFTLVLADLIIWSGTKVGINPYIAKLFSMIVVVVVNYIFSKLFIFKKD